MPLRTATLISLLVTTLTAVAAEDPLNARQNGPARHMTEAERRTFDRTPTLARADNVLFLMPDGWRRRDKDSGVSLIYPTDCPQGQWVELRFPPPEPKQGGVRDHLSRGLAQIKTMFQSQRELAAISVSRLSYGGEMVTLPLACTDDQQNTVFFILCYCEADDLVQPLIIATNNGQLYQKHQQTFTRVLDSVQFANLTRIAEGPPPLTMLTGCRINDILEWILDVPFTQEQKARIQEHLVKTWKTNDRKEIDACLNLINLREQSRNLNRAKQDYARQALQEQLLKQARANQDEIDKLLVAIYDAGHKPIAPGDPPLTRQVTDSVAELMYFMASQLDGGGEVAPGAEVKDQFANKLAASWANLDEKSRRETAQIPLLWAGIRAGWPEAPETERKKLVQQFADVQQIKELAAHFTKVRQTRAKSSSSQSYLELMSKMQRQHESYMFMSNMLHTSHQTNMMMIYSMGNGWTYRR